MNPEETIQRLRRRLEAAPNLEEDNRQRMLQLVSDLEKELDELGDEERHQSVHDALALADATAVQGTRPSADRNQDAFHKTLEAMQASMRELEIKHPKIAHILMGIGKAF